jgi:hypothetical protein
MHAGTRIYFHERLAKLLAVSAPVGTSALSLPRAEPAVRPRCLSRRRTRSGACADDTVGIVPEGSQIESSQTAALTRSLARVLQAPDARLWRIGGGQGDSRAETCLCARAVMISTDSRWRCWQRILLNKCSVSGLLQHQGRAVSSASLTRVDHGLTSSITS